MENLKLKMIFYNYLKPFIIWHGIWIQVTFLVEKIPQTSYISMYITMYILNFVVGYGIGRKYWPIRVLVSV